MDRHERLRVLLELDRRAGDRISGRIGVGDDLTEFSGWLSLIAVLEAARAEPEAGARPPPHHTRQDPERIDPPTERTKS